MFLQAVYTFCEPYGGTDQLGTDRPLAACESVEAAAGVQEYRGWQPRVEPTRVVVVQAVRVARTVRALNYLAAVSHVNAAGRALVQVVQLWPPGMSTTVAASGARVAAAKSLAACFSFGSASPTTRSNRNGASR